jgi:hypothetical protein
VEEVFTLPLDDLRNSAIRKLENVPFGDTTIEMYTYELDGRVIWGATAWMLNQLLEIIDKI